MLPRLRNGFCLVALCSLTFVFAGTKEELIKLQTDVLQLQNQIRLLEKNIDDKSSVLRSLLEQLNDQVAATNLKLADLAATTGSQRDDQQGGLAEIRQVVQGLGVKWDDTNARIAALQQKLEENQIKIQSLRQPPLQGSVMEPDQVYSSVYNDFLMGNYDLAIAGFQDFLANYPDSEYSDNASYYLGVSFQEQGRFERAIQAFDQVINLYPKADKTPTSYYKKAAAFERLHKETEAVDTLKRLIILFPDAQESVLACGDLQRMGIQSEECAESE